MIFFLSQTSYARMMELIPSTIEGQKGTKKNTEKEWKRTDEELNKMRAETVWETEQLWLRDIQKSVQIDFIEQESFSQN